MVVLNVCLKMKAEHVLPFIENPGQPESIEEAIGVCLLPCVTSKALQF